MFDWFCITALCLKTKQNKTKPTMFPVFSRIRTEKLPVVHRRVLHIQQLALCLPHSTLLMKWNSFHLTPPWKIKVQTSIWDSYGRQGLFSLHSGGLLFGEHSVLLIIVLQCHYYFGLTSPHTWLNTELAINTNKKQSEQWVKFLLLPTPPFFLCSAHNEQKFFYSKFNILHFPTEFPLLVFRDSAGKMPASFIPRFEKPN